MIYLGIDPGKSGGIAYIVQRRVVCLPMPRTERDTWEVINRLILKNCKGAMIEWIHPAIPGIGKSQMSKLYGNYMQLRGFLIATGISFEDVKPVAWQRGLGISPRKKTETRTQWKNRLKAKAQELFPELTITLATSDALLLAEYCRRKRTGTL